jgi:uncharacterized protein (DUF2141 family)
MIFFVPLSTFAQTTSLTVKVEGIKDEEGTVLLALYTSKSDFLSDNIFVGKKAHVQNGEATILIDDLPYGKYAISTFFDKNENGILDTNFIGIPREPYAFSMNPSSSFGPPSFEEASFLLCNPNHTVRITY